MNSKFKYLKRVEKTIHGDGNYPYDLFLSMDKNKRDFICIGEGSGLGSVGGSITPMEFVSGKWDEYIKRFDADWLKELILDIGVETISQQDIINYWENNDV